MQFPTQEIIYLIFIYKKTECILKEFYYVTKLESL